MIPKFRAWDKEKDRMIYPSTTGICFELDDEGINVLDVDIDYPDDHVFPKVDSILMQSTGLKNKNGVEIFEGDIVHASDSVQINQRDENGAYVDAFFEEIDEIDHVVFDNGGFRLKRTGLDVCICQSVEEFKVIGNIYENPELLKIR
ncbi:YopX family protein [Enterococcus raffinosus]|uniref:YopX family protein n=1 Tax=Enterococcus raffinosus TaxID=71452 RepID=UPI00288CADE0|nr:YopX family protein [Enterococcus raffinosus]MDT2525983.1 YopX family protein [Enterococcus raffinosus]MDT2536435.1 YopX family protein [Enterococcus raffinosus]MDT2593257.1 YopX family protein [Enterococcus raffinosus]